MNMNLSVVMGIVNQMSGPLRAMASDSDRYATRIRGIQDAQGEVGGQLAMIASLKQTRRRFNENSVTIAAATERLAAMEAKAQETGNSSAVLTERIAKQRARLERLNSQQDTYRESLTSTGQALTTAGVRVSQLDDEYERLNTRYREHSEEIETATRRYDRLRRAMAPLQRMNSAIRMPTIEGAKGAAMAGVGAIASFAGFGAIINDTGNQINVMSKAAGDVKMPVQELQAMRMQATMAGAEAEDMDAAIKEMALRWGEMKTLKSGAMNDYFKDTRNRQAYEDLMNAKDSSEAYLVLVREIAKETDVAKQNFMSDEFFGGDSEKMLSVLKGGVEGFNKAKAMLIDTGGPISDESIQNAKEFGSAFKKISAIADSLKISALTPIMKELSIWMKKFSSDMKNTDLRDEAIAKLRDVVTGTFKAFKFLGNSLLFLSKNYKEVIAGLALLKFALIGINAVIMMNPIGMLIAAFGAAFVAVNYLISKLVGFDVIIKTIGDGVGWLWDKIKLLISKMPTSLLPDSWKRSTSEINAEMDSIANKINGIKNKNAKIGITTNETLNKKQSDMSPGMRPISQFETYSPLGNQTMKSQSEVNLIIKSDKLVAVDKIKNNRGTDLNVDLGNMAVSY